MVSTTIIAQSVGLFSFVIGAWCFMQKDDRKFKWTMVALNMNHALHFLLLGAFTSSAISLLSATRTVTSLKIQSKFVAYLFILSMLMVSSLWATMWHDWLAVLGGSIGTYGLFCLKGIKMRVTMLVGSCCWLLNNVILGSIGGTMLELLAISVNVATMIRMRQVQPQYSN